MTESTRFETRLTDALGRYADSVPVEVDAPRLVLGLASASTTPGTQRRRVSDRARLSLAILVAVVVLLASLVVFGGRLLVPIPPVVVSPSPSMPAAAPTPAPTASPTLTPTESPAATPVVVLRWTAEDIGSQPAVSSIWRVGEWFVAVGPESSFAEDDRHVDAHFIRSRDGHTWESVPAPARGMEVETGTVDDGVLWVVGKLGTPAEPKRGIWTTRDGATWQRVSGVTGLDFGPGRVDVISHAPAGWLALAKRWIDAESQDGFMLRSTNSIAWTRMPYPHGAGPYTVAGLTSDGAQWLMATSQYVQGKPGTVQARTSDDGLIWTLHDVEVLPGPGSADAVAFGPNGFVIVGQILDGEHPHPRAWVSADGTTWATAAMDGLPDPAGETGLRLAVAFDGGYLAYGYRLDDTPSFWTSVDGSSWVEVDEGSGSDPVFVQALAASKTTFIAGGQTTQGGAFVWAAPH